MDVLDLKSISNIIFFSIHLQWSSKQNENQKF